MHLTEAPVTIPLPRTPSQRVRVLVVDDLEDMRALLRHQLSRHDDVEVAGEAADGLEAVERCRALQPDLVFLDVDMPRLGGLGALPLLREAAPGAAVVMLTSRTDAATRETALRAGAARFLDKAAGRAAILQAVDDLGR